MQEFISWITKYWLQVGFGLIMTALTASTKIAFSKVKKVKVQQKAIHGAILALLRDRINQSCKYHLTQREITSTDYEVLSALFKEYDQMGGNGVVHRLKSEIDKLPIKVQTNN